MNVERKTGAFAKIAVALGICLVLGGLWFRRVHADEPRHLKIAGRDVAVWKPSGAAPTDGFPLIIFSHGFGGCNTQSVFLMEALAKAGYLVVAPNHKDAGCGRAEGEGGQHRFRRPEEPFQKEEEWSDATYADRRADIEAVLDAALSGETFEGIKIDAGRVGISGHSLGGYTALGLAGAWPSWKDPRIKAVLALSPYCAPYIKRGALGKLGVPVMYQGGTRDLGITPFVQRPGGAYELSSTPKFFMELEGAGHFAWTNLNKTFQPRINEYSVAFFDAYLKGQSDPNPLASLLKKPKAQDVHEVRSSNQ